MERKEAVRNNTPVKIIITPFPDNVQGNVKGMCLPGKGCYIVLIDSTQPPEQQKLSIGHELAHIFLGHLDKGHNKSMEAMEREAKANADKYYRLYAAGKLC